MSKQYTEKSIKSLSDIEHVKMYPGMYGFDTANINQCFIEIFDNAVDEVVESNSTEPIYVTIDYYNKSVTITDKGRGIPHGAVNKVYGMLRTSGKFKDKESGYALNTSGIYGVGASVVNFLSKTMIVTVAKDHKCIKYTFVDGKLKTKSEIKKSKGHVQDNSTLNENTHGTEITFTPNEKFGSFIKEDYVRSYIENIIFLNPQLTVVLNIVSENQEVTTALIDKASIGEILKELQEMTQIDIKDPSIRLIIYFKYAGDNINSDIKSFVNNKETRAHGEHVNAFISAMASVTGFDKKYITLGLKMYVICYMNYPSLLAQTKEKLLSKVSDNVISKIAKQIKASQNFNDIKEALTINIAKYEASRHKREVTKIKKAGIDKFYDCQKNHNSELIIVEGKSAGSGIIKCRRPNQAVFLMTGKILNVEKADKKTVENNIVINSLLGIIDKFDKVLFATDADEDGLHIQYLLSLFANKFYSDKLDKFYIVDLPLFAVRHKDETIYTNDISSFIKGKYIITRFKGLGEMDSKDLDFHVTSQNRKLIPICEKSK